MAWIESHQTLAAHPKTRKAARALGIPPVHLIGHLHCLWHWALDLAEDGDLTKFDVDDLAIAAQWDGDAQQFVDALLTCGFGDGPGFLERDGSYGDPQDGLVGDLVLHDWWNYAGKLVARRQQDRQRKAARRSAHDPTDVRGKSDGTPEDVQGSAGTREPDPTEPDLTEPKVKSESRAAARRAPEQPIPPGWEPSPVHRQLAAEQGVDCDHEAAKFLDHAAANDRRQRDWDAAFRTWIRRARDYGATNGNARASPAARGVQYADRYRQAAAELERQGR